VIVVSEVELTRMIRVPAPAHSAQRDFSPHPLRAKASEQSPGRRTARLVALGTLGVVLGAGGALLSISYVQAFDDAGIRQVQMEDYARSQGARAAARQPQAQVYYAPSSYAPSRSLSLPFFRTNDSGRLVAPAPVQLNPFAKAEPGQQPRRQAAKRRPGVTNVALDTVSGAASTARSICVRVCDGFHAPLGYVTSQADVKAHESLCKAMNPGVPVKVYRVAAGASSIDEAVGPDGKSYASLPMAFAHEKSADPACRPGIVQANERRVSILKDFTLRPGDAVVVNGSARIFSGSSSYPFNTSDFRDFRSSGRLSDVERRKMDMAIGHSFKVATEREARRSLRMREASLSLPGTATDIPLSLRGSVANINDSSYYVNGERGRVRVIAPGLFMSGR
jgi:hypothetical protein